MSAEASSFRVSRRKLRNRRDVSIITAGLRHGEEKEKEGEGREHTYATVYAYIYRFIYFVI